MPVMTVGKRARGRRYGMNGVGDVTIAGFTFPTDASGNIITNASTGAAATPSPALAAQVTPYVPQGSYTPPTASWVNSNQPNVTGGGGFEPMKTVESYLQSNVLAQLLDPIGGASYVDLPTAHAMLTQAAQSYCSGGAGGGPNNPCSGVDQATIVNNLLQTYQQQAAAQGGNTSGTAIQGGPTGFTAFAPGYNSAGPGFILMPNGSKVPNNAANLDLAQNAYYASLGLPAGYSNGQPAASSNPLSTSPFTAPLSAPSATGYSPATPGGTSYAPGSAYAPSGAPVTINGTPTYQTPSGSSVMSTASGSTASDWLSTTHDMFGLSNGELLAGGAAALLLLLMVVKK